MIPDIAIRVCQIVPRERIKDHSVPLHLLYVDLVREKEIVPLSQLSEKEKRGYWNETDGDKFQRIVQASAIYIFDKITQS